MQMTKEDLKQALLDIDARAAEVSEVIEEMAKLQKDQQVDELEMARLLKSAKADDAKAVRAMMELVQREAASAMLLQTMAVMVTVGAKSVAIAKFMGIDPEVLKNLPKN